MKCPNCGANLTEEDFFCSECGTKLVKQKDNKNKGHSKNKIKVYISIGITIVVAIILLFVISKPFDLKTKAEPIQTIKLSTSNLDLADYPQSFVSENTLIVIGSNSATSDTLAAVDIGDTLKIGDVIPGILYDTEITNSYQDYNLILVGGPCANPLSDSVGGEKCDAWTLESGEALIKLVANGDKVAMLVAGTDAIDTRMAAKVIANYADYTLSGEKATITGTLSSPIII